MSDPQATQNRKTENRLKGGTATIQKEVAPNTTPQEKGQASKRSAPMYPRLVLIRTGEEPFDQTQISRSGRSKIDPTIEYVGKDGKQAYWSETQQAHIPVQGLRSILRLEIEEGYSVDYPAIERGNKFTHLLQGTYTGKMSYRKGKKGNQEIIVDKDIVIHSAAHPASLEGCIAPGRAREENGVLDSRQALKEINEGLGGWEEGKRVWIEVKGDYKQRPPKK